MGNESANGSNSEGSRRITSFSGLGGIVMATFNADGESWEATDEIHWLYSCGCDGISGRLIHLKNAAAQREGGMCAYLS